MISLLLVGQAKSSVNWHPQPTKLFENLSKQILYCRKKEI